MLKVRTKGVADIPQLYGCEGLNPISSVSYELQHLQGYVYCVLVFSESVSWFYYHLGVCDL